MAVETKGHSAISAVMRVKPPRRMHGLIVGVSFAVGLTFGATAGFAQIASDSAPATDETVEATTAEPAVTGSDGAETPEVLTTEATAQDAAQSDASQNADQEMVTPSGDATSAVVFMYHRFGEGEYPSTNITMEQFDQHVKELTSGPYTVLGVPQIVSALADGKGLPDRTIGITVDDAYRSVYEKAWPVFREHNLPFTVFVSTEQLDSGYANYMTWDMVRELSKAGVTIGGHSQNHAHLPDFDIDRVKAELANSAARFEEELGYVPEIFAYPYGEANGEVIAAVKEAGYRAAFGQQSGAMHTESDFMYLPRYALNEHYGAMDRFKLAANSLPLVVSDVTPADYTLTRNPPAFGFTLAEPAPSMNCYPSEGEPTMSRLGEERVEIRLDGPVSSGRWRINCTAMGPDSRWRWFGMLYTVP
ncbi:MAG: polysaccharide deacetylase family protein [Thalassospira sp.]|uniref:polysaccharide deacetylase family protein n=1 Tax=Thalassospira sp. TaxID=1912094 RepID=UPI001B2DE37E|nr:polysaccharide deacetylase family protein [Thalassospira sp.]MBO6578216.1 polysaccharide deacetylase family protein [Thalassospira sp.]MBO6802230.1 polysaccharide deacetylase family protein [Thalassospira sp.]MBO6817932.1 polysaccharide deacetylase family protein [Thalassospira sp.]MBO6886743.1 polysaccharide deacetylase family protein [Thalassospira sp.]